LSFTLPSHISCSSSDLSPPSASYLPQSSPAYGSPVPATSSPVLIPHPSVGSQDSAQLNLQAAALSLLESSSKIITRSQTGNLKPRRFPGFHLYSTRHPLQALHAGLVSPEPRTYSQAVSIPEWCAAMDSEFQSLLKNETWSLCSLPPDKNVVPCKWVFKLKR